MSFNYLSGEHVTNFHEGRPLLFRKPDAAFTLANVMRAHLTTAVASLRIGMDIMDAEKIELDAMTGHGGFFKAEGIGQKIMSAALGTPVTVMETASEGGPWGMAVLAAYLKNKEEIETLSGYLATRVFKGAKSVTVAASDEEAAGFAKFMEAYKKSLAVECAAVEAY